MKSSYLWTGLVASLVAVATAEAADSRWDPWIGCWELADDDRRDPLIGEADPTEGQDVPVRALVCLSALPEQDGVTVTTSANGEPMLEERLVANGERNPSAKGDCQGWQENRWSGDGHRLFTTAELDCEDDRHLTMSSLSMMVPRSTWVDIQVVESPAGRAVVVRRYRRADIEDVEAAGLADPTSLLSDGRSWSRAELTDALSAEDVAEAASLAEPEVVEAAVLEHEEGFDLDADTLIALDEAGVRPGLIDLMVALSYPDQFRVKSESNPGASAWLPSATGPYAYSTVPYYMLPFGGYSWYSPYYYPRRYITYYAPTRTLDRGLVSRQGYAQVSPRTTVERRARYRSGGGDDSSYSAGSSGSSSGGGTVSPSGYTRGGQTGRTAKPKRK